VTVQRLCQLAGMTRQNFYKVCRVRTVRQVDDALVLALVRQERALQPRLGTRKLLTNIGPSLAKAGVALGRDRLFALLRQHELLVPRRPRGCQTTHSRHRFATYGNVLRELSIERSGQAVVSDLTYLRTREGWLYLALVTDVYSRAILGYDCSDSLESQGAQRALERALAKLPRGQSTVHHSDRGIQYCCTAYIQRLQQAGCRISMTEENHCYENAMAERLNGILKQEYGLGADLPSKALAQQLVAEAVQLYNTRRPHQALGYRTPWEVYRRAA
jgi:putative transposase